MGIPDSTPFPGLHCCTIVTHNTEDFKGMDKFGIKVLTPKEFLQSIGEAK